MVALDLHARSLHWKLATRPELYSGEAYMDGSLTISQGTLWDLLDLVSRNLAYRRHRRLASWEQILLKLEQGWTQANSKRHAHHNVAHHYDLSRTLYTSFLDDDMQYSCAYFPPPSRLHGYYDDHFRRLWEFYLAGSEMSFRHGGPAVFQIQLSKSLKSVPLTRDYMLECERLQGDERQLRRERIA